METRHETIHAPHRAPRDEGAEEYSRAEAPESASIASSRPYQPDPQTLYNRAREAGAENRKLLVSLATGSLAFLFVGLTRQSPEAVTGFQKTVICLGLLFLALAVFAGVFAFQVDAWRNYAWARELLSKEGDEREQFRRERKFWRWVLKVCGAALYVFFLLGIAAAVIYVGARVLA